MPHRATNHQFLPVKILPPDASRFAGAQPCKKHQCHCRTALLLTRFPEYFHDCEYFIGCGCVCILGCGGLLWNHCVLYGIHTIKCSLIFGKLENATEKRFDVFERNATKAVCS